MARIPDAELPSDLTVHNNLIRATYNNPEMFRGFASLSGRVHSASHLPSRTRELVVLRISAKLGSDVEWGQHLPSALAAGVTASEASDLRSGSVTSLAPGDVAAVRFAEAVDECRVADVEWESAATYYTPLELMDIAMLACFYGLASRMAMALDVDVDEGLTGLADSDL